MGRAAAQAAGVAAAAAFFLWMYLASEPLTASVEAGAFGERPVEFATQAETYGYEWRHGQAGWPVYVPGFFVAAFAVAPLALHDSRRAFVVLVAGVAAGWAVAWLFAGAGREIVAREFAARQGTTVEGELTAIAAWRAFPAAATFVAWSPLVIGYGRAVRGDGARWVMAAGAGYIAVAGIRGTFAFGELARTWANRAMDGDVVAMWSAGLVVATFGGLTACFRASREPAGSDGAQQRAMSVSTP